MKISNITILAMAFCGLLASIHPAAAQGAIVFSPAQSTWRYSDAGLALGTTFVAPLFDDSAWSSGPARLGFGGDGEQTQLQPGHLTYFFRKTFLATNGVSASNLLVRLKRDDGAVVHLNGIEVFRSNMPTGMITHLTAAASAATGSDETNVFISPVLTGSILQTGTNVVAVSVHQNIANSADLGFDLELTGNAPIPSNLVVTLPAGWSTIANNFVRGGNTLNEVIPVAADGTVIYKWNFATQNFDPSTYDALFGEWMPNRSLNPGEGSWIYSPVPQGINFLRTQPSPPARPGPQTRPTAPGLRFVSCRWPVSSTFDEINGFAPITGDRVLTYEGSFTIIPNGPTRTFTFSNGVWNPTLPLIPPGQSVFVDLAPPACVAVFCPTNMAADCAGPNGTAVSFTVRGTNYCFPPDTNPVFIECSRVSGSSFLSGTTTVSCYAWSRIGPSSFQTNYCNFTVTVRSNCPPPPQCVFALCSTNIAVDCQTATGAVVNFSARGTNYCNAANLGFVCDPPSGRAFRIGTTTVNCWAIGSGQTNHCSFTVTVRDNCSGQDCFSLSAFPEMTPENPWEVAGYRFITYNPLDEPHPANNLTTLSGYRGLFTFRRLEIDLPYPCSEVTMEIFREDSPLVRAEAFRLAGSRADTDTSGDAPAGTGPETLTLRSYGDLITRVRVTSDGPALLLNICGRRVLFNDVTRTENCKDYSSRPTGFVPNPLEETGFKISAFDSGGGPVIAGIVEGIAGRTLAHGYYVQHTVDVELTPPCRSVRVDFFQLENPVTLTALDSDGAVVGVPFTSPGSVGPEGVARSHELTSTGNLIRRVVVHAPNALATIQRICCVSEGEGKCVDFPLASVGGVENPLTRGGYTFTTFFHREPDLPWVLNYITTRGGETGLRLALFTDIQLSAPCSSLEMSFRDFASVATPMTVKLFNSAGAIFDTLVVTPPLDAPFVLPLSGDIHRVSLERANTNALLTRLCCLGDAEPSSAPLGPFLSVGQTSWAAGIGGSLVVSNRTQSGLDGLRFDLTGQPLGGVEFAETTPASNMPPGATFSLLLRGRDLEVLGQMHWTASDDFWKPAYWSSNELAGSGCYFETIQSPTYTARVFSGNQLVGEWPGLRAGVELRCIPPKFFVEHQASGQLRVSLEYGNSGGLFRFPGLASVSGTRLDLISERPQPMVPLGLRVVDLRWSRIPPRTVLPTDGGCLVIIAPDRLVTCAGLDGATVHYTVMATNTCTHVSAPVSCVPPSDAHFDLGVMRVTCVASTFGGYAFGSFLITVTTDGSSGLVENPSFEIATPAAPAGGRPFFGVPGWTLGPGSVSLFGPGGFAACEGTNYAGLSAELINGVFVGGTNIGQLTQLLTIGGDYEFQACLTLARGGKAWVEFVLSDGDPAHEQLIARELPDLIGLWQPLIRSVHFSPAPGAPSTARFTARYAHDRIIVRTRQALEGRASQGCVLVDHLRLGCFRGLMIDDRVVQPASLPVRWTGDGKLQMSPTLGVNAPWTDANVPISHDLNQHSAIVPVNPQTPATFLRLIEKK